MKITEYFIDENLAKLAKEMNSFDDYKENSETQEYLTILNNFENEINLLITDELSEEKINLIEYYANKYSEKLANAFNKLNAIRSRCPSVMIVGAGNFPVEKKRKQNEALDKFYRENDGIFDARNNYYYGKIYNVIFNSSNSDVQMIKKIENKIKDFEEMQKEMEEENEYYKKNKTMVGYKDLSDEDAQKIDEKTELSQYKEKQPYSNRLIKSVLNNIEKLKSEIDDIANLKNDTNMYSNFDKRIKIIKNPEIMRIQIFFDDMPNEKIRTVLKKCAFKWSPTNKAWQRQLTQNAIYVTEKLIDKLFKEM